MVDKKVALVTGASSGIGESTANELHRLGYIVYAAARRVEKMAGLSEQGIHVIKMDVTDDASMIEGVNRILREQGQIDVLVNNAGYGSYGSLEDVPLDEGRYQFEVNVFGLARLSQLVIPSMRERKSGRIINVSSIGGKGGEPLGSWYHATKFAVEGMSDSMRYELKPFGIDVVIIEPGAIYTEWGQIAIDNLLKTSEGGAYSQYAKQHAKVLGISTDPNRASHPQVIGEEIGKAVTARRPKIRYAAGAHAKSAMFFRKILPDRIYDAFILRFYARLMSQAATTT